MIDYLYPFESMRNFRAKTPRRKEKLKREFKSFPNLKCLGTATALTAILLLLSPGLVRAEAPASDTSEVLQIQSKSKPKGLQTLVDINADDAFLPKILSVLAELSGYNVVAGPEVNNKQRISIHLKDTPIEEAVNLVVRAAGLSYEIVGNSFLVTQQENLKMEVGIVSHLIELEYAKAEEIKTLLKGLTENIEVSKGRNAILVTTSPKVISEIRKIVARVDVPSRQLMLQTRIIEVSIDKLKKLGIDWERLSKLTTILVENPSDLVEGGRVPTNDELGTFELGKLPTEHVPENIDGLENVGHFSRQLSAFDITVDWLLKTNKGRLLTDTKLTTMNNRKASIHIGEIIPFLVQSEQTAQVEREEIGIKLEITPQISKDGFIVAQVKPEVSTIIELIDGRIPRKKIRTAETTVIVKNKQKIYIAGLISENEQIIVHKIPFFGDLLFFGRFFQHLEKSRVRTDLIIEITPFILDNTDQVSSANPDSLYNLKDSLENLRDTYEKTAEGAGPTRFAFVPTPEVLKPYQYVIGIREISVGQFNRFQLTFCPWQHIGGLLLGIKYQLAPTFAVGVGYNRGNEWWNEEYDLGSRVGLFLTKGFVNTPFFNWNTSLDLQLGEYISRGAGTGISLDFHRYLALMAEGALSHTPKTPDGGEYWDTHATAAFRARWPWLSGLSFEAGMEYRAEYSSKKPWHWGSYEPGAYFDLAYSGVF